MFSANIKLRRWQTNDNHSYERLLQFTTVNKGVLFSSKNLYEKNSIVFDILLNRSS